MEREIRHIEDAELRTVTADDGSTHIVGYAAKYGVLSHQLRSKFGPFKEIIKPGAFDNALKRSDNIVASVEHNLQTKLGRMPKTLKVWSDDKGLAFDTVVPNTTVGKDALEEIRSEMLNGCSFGFTKNVKDTWAKDKATGMDIRTINEFDKIIDVTLTGSPAYPETELSIRSLDEFHNEIDKVAKTETKVEPPNDIQKKKIQLMELNSSKPKK